MKKAKTVFSIIFTAIFIVFSLGVLVMGTPGLLSSLGYAFPSVDGMKRAGSYAAYSAFPWRTSFLELQSSLQALAGKTESGGFDIVAANDGSFVEGHSDKWFRADVEGYALKLAALQRTLNEKRLGASVIFLSAQSQVVNGYTEPESHYPLPRSSNLEDTMLYYLRAYHVDFLDVGLTLRESTLAPSEYVYKTDTKWTTEASFMTSMALLGKLKDQYGASAQIDPMLIDFNSYRNTTYEKIFMGTMGMAAGEPFTGKEDFVVITPNFDTDFTYEAEGETPYAASGDFRETLFNEKILYPDDQYVYNSYSSYLGGGAYYFRKITNNIRPDGARALFVHDASTLPLAALMAPAFSETYMYWPGLAPASFDLNLIEFVDENEIDFVIFQSEADIHSLNDLFNFELS